MGIKLCDLQTGDMIVAKFEFACFAAGRYRVCKSQGGDFYVYCRNGRHFLKTLAQPDGTIAEFERFQAPHIVSSRP